MVTTVSPLASCDTRSASAAERHRLLEEFRVESIQRAAMEVIASKGIAGATMQGIADAAGMAKGTLYLYFENRAAVMESAVNRAIGQLMAALEELLARPSPVSEVLPLLIERHFAFFDQHQVLFRVYHAVVGQAAADSHRRSNTHYHRYLEQLRQLVQRGIASGELIEVDPDRLVTFFAEGTRALLLRRILDDSTPPPGAADAELIANVLLRGLLRERNLP